MDLRVPSRARLLAAPALLAVLVAGALPAAAHAQQLPQPSSYTKPPPFHRLSANRAIAIARTDGKVRGEERKRGHLAAYAYLNGPVR